MKVWITKYALTKGIAIVDGKRNGSRFIYFDESRQSYIIVPGVDWYMFELDAVGRAREVQRAEIASLKKSLAKLEAMTFEPSAESP